jgi:glutamine amidotransferase
MLAIIDGCGSNISSIQFALQRLGVNSQLTRDRAAIQAADQVILPGVGHAQPAMQALQDYQLVDTIRSLNQPVLGICLGMQLLYERSAEGNVDCLGIIPGCVEKLPSEAILPHMGWNQINNQSSDYAYFVHSYAAPVNDYTLATCRYSDTFTAIVAKDNFIGMQFHPEKSAEFGEKLLRDFLTGDLT